MPEIWGRATCSGRPRAGEQIYPVHPAPRPLAVAWQRAAARRRWPLAGKRATPSAASHCDGRCHAFQAALHPNEGRQAKSITRSGTAASAPSRASPARPRTGGAAASEPLRSGFADTGGRVTSATALSGIPRHNRNREGYDHYDDDIRMAPTRAVRGQLRAIIRSRKVEAHSVQIENASRIPKPYVRVEGKGRTARHGLPAPTRIADSLSSSAWTSSCH
jgi:hypothetical protein